MTVKDIKLREQMERGQRAEIALQELEKIFEAIRQECHANIENSAFEEDSVRLEGWMLLKVMEQCKTMLTVAVRNGEASHKELIKIVRSQKRKVVNV